MKSFYRNKSLIILFNICLISLCVCDSGSTGPLLDKARAFQQKIEANHLRQGLLIPTIIEVTEGPQVFTGTSREDCCTRTGEYVFAMSMRYAVTGEDSARQQASQSAQALLTLERVTGVPGVIARCLEKRDAPTIEEEAYFFPAEWHSSTTMPGFRWLGDLSVDQLNDWLIGLSMFYDLAANEDEKVKIRAAVERVMDRVIENDMRIVDIDGKMTLWGNMSPSLPHESLNTIFALGDIKCAYHVTRKEAYRDTYQSLINDHGYIEEVLKGKVLFPEYAINRSDDNLGAESLYILMRYEDDPDLKHAYLIALERHWLRIKNENDPAFDIIREAIYPGRGSITDKTWDNLRKRECKKQLRRDAYMRTESGGVTISGYYQDAPYYYIRAYWIARYHKILSADD
jgi:hypothetical protein